MTEINGLNERITDLKMQYQEAERINLKSKAGELLADINYLEELRELRSKQEPCEDAVSRAEVIKIAKEMYLEVANMELDVKTISDCISYTSSKCREVLERKLQSLPPITPQEPFINKPCVSSEICEHDKQKVLDKIRAEIEQLRNFRAENYDLEQYCDCFDARIIFRDDVFEILDKYKAESEDEK